MLKATNVAYPIKGAKIRCSVCGEGPATGVALKRIGPSDKPRHERPWLCDEHAPKPRPAPAREASQ
jgi:hypothetical protein